MGRIILKKHHISRIDPFCHKSVELQLIDDVKIRHKQIKRLTRRGVFSQNGENKQDKNTKFTSIIQFTVWRKTIS